MAHKAVFLDRDDTLVDDPGYIQRPEQVMLLPGAAEALVQLKKMGYLLVVVTNQSGVARGLVTEEDLEQIHQKLKSLLAAEGAGIDAIYYCPYHPKGTLKDFSIESNLRKPNAGMFFQAEEELQVNLDQSWMIGDSYRDIQAGKAAGCHTILVDVPGKIREKKETEPEPDRKAVNLREAVNIIRMHEFHQRAQSSRKINQQRHNTEESSESSETKETDEADSDRSDTINPPIPIQTQTEKVTEETQAMPSLVHSESEAETTDEELLELEKEILPEPAKIYTAKSSPQIEKSQDTDSGKETQYLLEEVLHRLKTKDREGLYEEFSVFKLLSLMLQVVAVVCLVISFCFWLSPKAGNESVIIMIGYAVALQLVVIALLMMHSND
ncbi:MAG: D-glycero-alpha-D-manno-heptose-1,7-bisphosphate 7-phosphatase [Planctomycetota bacterium]|jgi:D,D-heptose 1,7-bisphosphate phosphatase